MHRSLHLPNPVALVALQFHNTFPPLTPQCTSVDVCESQLFLACLIAYWALLPSFLNSSFLVTLPVLSHLLYSVFLFCSSGLIVGALSLNQSLCLFFPSQMLFQPLCVLLTLLMSTSFLWSAFSQRWLSFSLTICWTWSLAVVFLWLPAACFQFGDIEPFVVVGIWSVVSSHPPHIQLHPKYWVKWTWSERVLGVRLLLSPVSLLF